MKVILFIFSMILILYCVYYFITMSQKIRVNKEKVEKFTNLNIEEFTDKQSQYDARILILNAIETNNITDKQKRLDISTKLFSNIEQYRGMSQEQLNAVVAGMTGNSMSSSSTPPTQSVTSANNTMESFANSNITIITDCNVNENKNTVNVVPPAPLLKPTSCNNNAVVPSNSIDTINKFINDVSDKMKDFKSYVQTISSSPPPKENVAIVENFEQTPHQQMFITTPNIQQFTINGIENIRSFAPFAL